MIGKSLVLSIISGILHPNRLSILVVFVTNRCNASCGFCFNDKVIKKDDIEVNELSLEEYIMIAEKTGRLIQLIIGGGEPFLRPDLVEIIEAFYLNCSPEVVSLPTNAVLAKKIPGIVRALAEKCPRAVINIEVSVDSIKQRHDSIRGVTGLFDNAMELIDKLYTVKSEYPNINPVINTAVTEYNIEDIISLGDYLRKRFPGKSVMHNIVFDCRSDSGLFSTAEMERNVNRIKSILYKKGISIKKNIMPFLLEKFYIGFINKLMLYNRKNKIVSYGCNAGKKIEVILPDGSVSPCEPFVFEKMYDWFNPLNIKDYDYDITRLNKAPAFKETMRFISEKGCNVCNWSCAAISSMIYTPGNWPLLIKIRDKG